MTQTSVLEQLLTEQAAALSRLEARLVDLERPRRCRTLLRALGAGVLAVACMAGISAADPIATNTAPYFPIPAHKIYSATSVAAFKSLVPVVTGGATTVPTGATHVTLSVNVTYTQPGSFCMFPAPITAFPNITSANCEPLTNLQQAAPNTFTVLVGYKNEIAIYNASSAAIKVTASIIGYDYAGEGAYQDFYDGANSSGSVAANTDFTAGSLTLPAGTYDIRFSASVSSSPGVVNCRLQDSLGTQHLGYATGTTNMTITLETVESIPDYTPTTTVTVYCHSSATGWTFFGSGRLIALPVGPSQGAVQGA